MGYGDKYPITLGGRATAVVMLWSGVALIGVLSAYLANLFLRPTADDVAFAADGATVGAEPAEPDDAAVPPPTAAELRALAADLETRLVVLRAAISRLPDPDSDGPPT